MLFAIDNNGKEPLSYLNYTQNKGQWNKKVLFRSEFRGGSIFVENTVFTYLFFPKDGIRSHTHNGTKENDPNETVNFHTVRMEFDGSLKNHSVKQQNLKSFYHNYFKGNDKSTWATKVPVCGEIIYGNLYNNIDLKIFGAGNNVRYDFIILPGGDAADIRLKFIGQERLFLKEGKLVIATSVGEIIQNEPYAFQEKKGIRKKIGCHYELFGNSLKIIVDDNYDKSFPLIIDPTLVFSTYTGSITDNWGMSASFDQYGNAYTAGICFNNGYPTTPGAFQTNYNGLVADSTDITLTKFNATGDSMIFSTYLGGLGKETPQSITVDNNDCLIVLGRSSSSNFPMVSTCYDITKAGGTDIIVTKFDATGSMLLASTFIGGSGEDGVNITATENLLGSLKHNYADDGRGAVHVDELNNVYVASCTNSSNFPVTPGCFQAVKSGLQDGCVFKLNSGLSQLMFSSYLGGSLNDAAYNLALDSQDQLYVTGGTESTNFPTTGGVLHTSNQGGIDGFLTHISLSTNSILQSTYLGTSSYEQSYFVQIDLSDNVYVYGQCSGNYSITAGTYSNSNSGQFIHKLDPTLATTFFSTEFGSGRGVSDIVPSAFLVDDCQNICISGWGGPLYGYNLSSSSTSLMPVTPNAFQSNTDGSDFYFASFTRDAQSLQYATFFGGGTSLEHVDGGTSCFDKTGIIYQAICASCGGNQDMPTTPGAWSNTNNSYNCNNGLVKFQMDLYITIAQSNFNLDSYVGCIPFTVNFSNNSTNAVSFYWDFGDGVTTNNTAPAHTYSATGTYSVLLIATDLNTCNQVDTAFINITVNPAPLIVPGITAPTICHGDSAQVSLYFASASSYSWQPPSSITNPSVFNPKVFPPITTIYSVTLKDSLCNTFTTRTVQINVLQNNTSILSNQPDSCVIDTIRLSANIPDYISYVWNNGDTNSYINTIIPGLYTLNTLDSNGCKGFDSLRVNFYLPVPITAFSTTLCAGQNTQFASPVGSYQYSWWPNTFLSNTLIPNPVANPIATTVYSLQIKNGPCITSNTFAVKVNPLPVTEIIPSTTNPCIADTVVLKTTYIYPNYSWTTGETANVINVISSGIYGVDVTDANGCKGSDSIQVTILLPISARSSSLALCEGQYAQLFAPTGNYQYQWYPNTNISGTTLYNPVVTPKSTSVYTVVISNGPCVISLQNTVYINPVPPLSLNLKTTTLLAGEGVQLHAKTSAACIWYPDLTLSCNNCDSPIATPEENTIYYCYVTNKYGCINTQSVIVEIAPSFYVPNSFSPNNDGLNDIFRPVYTGFTELSVTIFNRWGDELYSWNSLTGGWDGTYKGKVAEDGTYVYKISALDNQRNRIERTGPVILLK